MSHLVKHPTLKSSTGEPSMVGFYCNGFRGCCGVTSIYSVQFQNCQAKDKEKMYDWFFNEVIMGNTNIDKNGFGDPIDRDQDHWKVNKFVVTDRVRPNAKTDKPSLYGFCKYIGAEEGTITYNPNSGQRVQEFGLTRPKNKYHSRNGGKEKFIEQKQEVSK